MTAICLTRILIPVKSIIWKGIQGGTFQNQRDEAKRQFKDRFGMPDRLPSARYQEALAYATELTALPQGTGESTEDGMF